MKLKQHQNSKHSTINRKFKSAAMKNILAEGKNNLRIEVVSFYPDASKKKKKLNSTETYVI